MDDFYYKPGPAPRKAEIINPNPWDASAVIRELADPWVARLAADELGAVARDFPTLGVFGWNLSPPLVDESIECFAIASAWLRRLERSQTRQCNSYAIKHILEYESQASYVYMPNGLLIAAAISVGISQQRSPNSMLGLKPPPNNWQWKIWPGSRIRALLPEEPLNGRSPVRR